MSHKPASATTTVTPENVTRRAPGTDPRTFEVHVLALGPEGRAKAIREAQRIQQALLARVAFGNVSRGNA